jgi:hypothetical protein
MLVLLSSRVVQAHPASHSSLIVFDAATWHTLSNLNMLQGKHAVEDQEPLGVLHILCASSKISSWMCSAYEPCELEKTFLFLSLAVTNIHCIYSRVFVKCDRIA